jgi:hypothetical protein
MNKFTPTTSTVISTNFINHSIIMMDMAGDFLPFSGFVIFKQYEINVGDYPLTHRCYVVCFSMIPIQRNGISNKNIIKFPQFCQESGDLAISYYHLNS